MMKHTRRRWITGMVLILWTMLGPIGMAFSACAMMAGCEGAYTLTSCLTPCLPMVALSPIGSVPVWHAEHPLMTMLKVPDPPPRTDLTAA
jgi:hypothetical protein